MVYQDGFEKTYLRKLYRIIIQNFLFTIEDYKNTYKEFINILKYEDESIYNIIDLEYFNNGYSYIPYDKQSVMTLKMFVTNISDTKIIKILNKKIKNNIDYFPYPNKYINDGKINCNHDKHENNKPDNDLLGYLYIIKEREFNRLQENVYKIGCTKDIITRYKQYPKGSIMIYSIAIKNYKELEKKWIINLNKNKQFIKRNDIGREYFEGDYIIIINELMRLI
jgi:hypothetical protein